MQRDIRNSDLFKSLLADASRSLRPGSGLVASASDVQASADGRWLSFTGVVVDKLQGSPGTRVCVVDAQTGTLRSMTSGSGQRKKAMVATVNAVNGRKYALSLSAMPIRKAVANSRPTPTAAIPRSMPWASDRLP